LIFKYAVRNFCLALFFATVSVLLLSEVLVRTYWVGEGLETYQKRLLTFRGHVAVFGDSRVANGIASSELVANFGLAGDNLEGILGKVIFFQERHPDARIVVQIDPHQFSAYRLNGPVIFDVNKAEDGSSFLMISGERVRAYLVPFVKRCITSLISSGSLCSREIEVVKQEVTALDPSDRFDLREVAVRFAQQKPLGQEVVQGELEQLTKKLNNLFSADNICLATFPVSASYLEVAERWNSYRDAGEAIARWAAEIRLRYVDAENLYATDRPIFSDPDHLSISSRSSFSDFLIESCFGAEN
jgi:hypothetical protein